MTLDATRVINEPHWAQWEEDFVFANWRKMSDEGLAECLGRTVNDIGIQRSILGLSRCGSLDYRLEYGAYNPTPEEIAAATAKIREGWSDDERERRKMIKHAAAEVPLVRQLGLERRQKHQPKSA